MSLLLVTPLSGAGLVPALPFLTCSFPLASSSIPVSGFFFFFFSFFSFLGQPFYTQGCLAEQQPAAPACCIGWGSPCEVGWEGWPSPLRVSASRGRGETSPWPRATAATCVLAISLQIHNPALAGLRVSKSQQVTTLIATGGKRCVSFLPPSDAVGRVRLLGSLAWYPLVPCSGAPQPGHNWPRDHFLCPSCTQGRGGRTAR